MLFNYTKKTLSVLICYINYGLIKGESAYSKDAQQSPTQFWVGLLFCVRGLVRLINNEKKNG
jgi:hypothetical protein